MAAAKPPLRSIRTRLIVGILLLLCVVLGAAAIGSYTVGRHEAEEIFDARLATSARVLEALVARQMEHATISQPIVISLPRELESSSGKQVTPLGHPYETKIAFQVWRDDGVLLARSASAPTQPFAPNVGGFSDQVLNGEQWQVFVLLSNNTSIHVAENDDVRNELVHDLGMVVMAPLAAGAVFLLIVVNLLIIYGFAPLGELAARIQSRAPGALGRLDLDGVPKEVAPVVEALNDLLSRLSLAFEHERRFTDAAAHELRTPLAALKIHADNLARARTEAERAESLQKLRQGLDRAIRLSEQMLAYSRAQNAGEDEARVPLRLADAVADTVGDLEPLRRLKSQRVKLVVEAAGQEAVIRAEPGRLRRLISNLLDNASRYAPPDSEIVVKVSAGTDKVVLSVFNPGQPIPAELRERVFDPYYRIPGSGSDGSGLGLAIVREIADRHGAVVRLDSPEPEDGILVTVTFPRAMPGSAED